MSFEIFWDKLDSEIASSIREKINSHFQQVKRPSFLGEIEILDFNFGTIPPVVEIVDITDPFPEFYWTDDEEDGEEYTYTDELSENGSYYESNSVGGDTTSHASFNSSHRLSHKFHSDNYSIPRTPSLFSEDGYFDSSNARNQPSLQSGPSTRASPMIPSHNQRSHAPVKQDSDAQIHLSVTYNGDMRLTIATELQLNYPSIAFMSLPVRLTVTGFSFSGMRLSLCNSVQSIAGINGLSSCRGHSAPS
ncbi:hypothetical protein K493DRAFT_311093 [Basidiobolus meristosporus CBS 931.73]|uniref:SMP-LTD domain-containing protein n=1 Tax=Basidiobolus meristosporus CBS 931.73 TaxID=1314790 RepID=A0A1Y1Z4R6_9FUNG|nr:hypothetical protein K493DRAFT_311093 [Basidiobolus meristosporus CBS 931.73]|eukprot:ORY05104.1 hypothetical protein K493DRAFT_311093 [Basidiobolus meristosporus CBS 931.73]